MNTIFKQIYHFCKILEKHCDSIALIIIGHGYGNSNFFPRLFKLLKNRRANQLSRHRLIVWGVRISAAIVVPFRLARTNLRNFNAFLHAIVFIRIRIMAFNVISCYTTFLLRNLLLVKIIGIIFSQANTNSPRAIVFIYAKTP